jgi:hypothetical protein
MRESFIGHEARIAIPCEVSVVALLMGFVEELLLVEGSDIEAPETVEEQLRTAIEDICDGDVAAGPVEAALSVVSDGVEIRLTSPISGHEPNLILVREE